MPPGSSSPKRGYDPVYGARPLRRFVAQEVETRLGRALLAGDVRPTLVVLRDGAEVARQIGAAPEAALRRWLEGALASAAAPS